MKIRNWDKVKDTNDEQVWVSKIFKLRVVVAKGDKAYTSWFEKNIGKVSSDRAYIENAYIIGNTTRDIASSMAISFMKAGKF